MTGRTYLRTWQEYFFSEVFIFRVWGQTKYFSGLLEARRAENLKVVRFRPRRCQNDRNNLSKTVTGPQFLGNKIFASLGPN